MSVVTEAPFLLTSQTNVANTRNSTVNATQYSLQGTNLVPNPPLIQPQTAFSYPVVGNPRQLQLATRFSL
jgi:hypothetical protein